MTLSEKIKTLRKDNNETQTALAKAIKTNERTVRRWESDSFVPSTETVVKLAQHFNVSTDYLLDNKPTVDTVAHAYAQLTPAQQKELSSLIHGNDR